MHLNKVECYAVIAAQKAVEQAQAALNAAMQEFNGILTYVGLDPKLNWSIDATGMATVIHNPSNVRDIQEIIDAAERGEPLDVTSDLR